ncbi:alpha/beta fold hydrolase [Bradyrhizobium sp. PRIMUS42]|uniref:alpha/beta fold hydrolase n=1 Tax=Bradyrhizobium sp. PRIMUS42 TaxID=2908926 RepID=UPI001FF364C1|nr:alpha/beta hydrolase [Bradyrhizobium sp. PRIMUS42]MCJ9728652.1 alpha/beta hydrolase [Bradyrhizobium sp. PRIMUS42]
MPFVQSEGVRIYAESTGTGTPIVFVHEFAGDYRNWENQVRFFARKHQCITFNARGYPPSDVPEDVEQYSQALAVEDIASVLRHFGVERAHIIGLSMGGYATLNFGLAHPEMALSLVVTGAGHGSDPDKRMQFLHDSSELADRLIKLGMQEGIVHYANSPIRRRYKEKDPRGFEEFNRQFAEHSAIGSSLTTRGCQLRRPTIYGLEAGLRVMDIPTLVVTGDDDEPCLEPALFMKRCIPDARLWVVPRTTHPVNLEEPEMFNRVVSDFISDVEYKHRSK